MRAAVELYASDGIDVPLEKIADRAQVGRGTLYRNFPDRAALAAAVADARLDDLAKYIAELGDRADALFLAIRELAGVICAASGFEKITTLQQQSPSGDDAFRAGVERLLAEPLERAKAAGLVRSDFPLVDVSIAALMVAGGGLDTADRAGSLDRAMALLAIGLSPAGLAARATDEATAGRMRAVPAVR